MYFFIAFKCVVFFDAFYISIFRLTLMCSKSVQLTLLLLLWSEFLSNELKETQHIFLEIQNIYTKTIGKTLQNILKYNFFKDLKQ